MIRALHSAATPGKYVVLHITVTAIIITSLVMILSAGELGPVAAFVIPFGMYAFIFGACIELLFWSRLAIAALARYILNRSESTGGKAK
jgi:hypothetical protein